MECPGSVYGLVPVLGKALVKQFKLFRSVLTDACDYFALDNLPKLSLGRNTEEQITMCFAASGMCGIISKNVMNLLGLRQR